MGQKWGKTGEIKYINNRKKKVKTPDFSGVLRLFYKINKPKMGLEPTTYALRMRRSTN